MEVLTVGINKGGTAKTTTAAAMAQAATARGMRALAIDLDPQGSLTLALAGDPGRPGSFELMQGAAAADLIQASQTGPDIIPASMNLAAVTSFRGSARRLQAALEEIRADYDLIIIDTPHTAGELQYNAMQASTGLLIPAAADVYSLQGLYQIMETAERIRRSNPELTIKGFIITEYDGRSNIAKTARDALIKNAGPEVPYLGTVRKAAAVQEAAGFRVSLFKHAPKSTAARDYMAIFDKIMK